MSERLTTRDLIEFLANQTGLEHKHAEKFIYVLSSYISHGIERNKVVRILGLGTFKIILVRERESVHIQTGERFLIQAHHKLSFIPDKGFKEQINRPFAFFEPIETTTGHTPKKVSFKKDTQDVNIVDDIKKQDENINPVVIIDDTPVISRENGEDLSSKHIEVPDYFSETDHYLIEDEYNGPVSVVEYEEQESVTEEYEPESDTEEFQPDFIEEEENVLFIAAENDEADISTKAGIEEETFIDEDNRTNTIEKKNKGVRLWMWFLLLPLLVIIGSGIATYTFLYYNYDRSSAPNQTYFDSEQDFGTVSQSSPMPIGFSPSSINDITANVDDYEVIDEFSPDSASQETISGETENNSETDALVVKEERKVIDWLAPTSENTNSGTKRANKPNEKIESNNRDLQLKSVAKTTTPTTTSAENTSSRASTVSENKAVADDNKEKKIPERVRMTAGTSLTQIALEYYGDKVFWVYIYEHNKSRIKNFNNIPVGTEIRLPLPRTYGINAKNKSSVDKAKQKQSQLLK